MATQIKPKRKRKLIPKWRKAWKLFSVQVAAVGIAVTSQYAIMYERLKEYLTPQQMMWIIMGVFTLGILVRIIKQTPEKESDETES